MVESGSELPALQRVGTSHRAINAGLGPGRFAGVTVADDPAMAL
jgi:hypothetical protein